MIKKITHVFYDWDNTLLNTDPLTIKTLETFFKNNNVEFQCDNNSICEINNLIFEDYIADFFSPEKAKEKLLEYKEIYTECRTHAMDDGSQFKLKLLNEAEKTLSTLYEAGLTQGIISNKPNKDVSFEVNKFNIDKYFSFVVGPHDNYKPKPSLDLFSVALSKLNILNVDKNNIIFVGDSIIDIKFAINIGIKIIFIGKEKFLEPYSSEIKAGMIMNAEESHANVLNIISNLI